MLLKSPLLFRKTFPLFLLIMQVSLLAQSGPCSLSKNIATVIDDGVIEELYQTQSKLVKCGQWPDSLALVWHRLGTAYYGMEQLDSAIFFTQAAQQQWELVNGATFTLAQGKSNFNLGYFLKERGNYLQAKPYLQKAVAKISGSSEKIGNIDVESIRSILDKYQNESKVDTIAIPTLTGYETLMIDGDTYEAFNTSGGLGSFAKTISNAHPYERFANVDLNYKTIRWRSPRPFSRSRSFESRGRVAQCKVLANCTVQLIIIYISC